MASLAPSTRKAYSAAWSAFESFCTANRLLALPASASTVAEWLAWRSHAGGGGSARRDVAAVRDMHILRRLPDPTTDSWLQRVVQGALRLAASTRPARAPRDALPRHVVDALLTLVPASGTQSASSALALRDAAVISLGLSLMRRAGELAALRIDDIHVHDGQQAVVCIRRSKTDQLGRGLDLPVTGPPVTLLTRWLQVRHLLVPRSPHLFVSTTGAPLTTAAIGSIVKRAAALAGLEGSFSAHSLRIGGASAALAAGSSLSQIQAIGGWSSDSVLRYLRPALATVVA